jgi:hypothetical protein
MKQSQPSTANKAEFNERSWLAVLLTAAMLTSVGIGAIFIFDLAPKHSDESLLRQAHS